MSDAYVIEIGEEAIGIVARESNGFRFYAAKGLFRPLEGRVFESARKAHSAALDLRRRSASTPPQGHKRLSPAWS
jgi:hypothetical protein